MVGSSLELALYLYLLLDMHSDWSAEGKLFYDWLVTSSLESTSPLDPRFKGSDLAGVDGFFQSIKIPCRTSRLPSEGKSSRWSRVVDLRHVKEPQAEIKSL